MCIWHWFYVYLMFVVLDIWALSQCAWQRHWWWLRWDVPTCLSVAYYDGLYEGINSIVVLDTYRCFDDHWRPLRWGPIMVTLWPERVVRQFGYVQTIPPSPISATLSYEDINDRWMHYSNHLTVVGQICLVAGQVSGDYMEWFFLISHPFITPTQAGDQPRHPHVPQHEAYVEPNIPEVPMAAEGGPS